MIFYRFEVSNASFKGNAGEERFDGRFLNPFSVQHKQKKSKLIYNSKRITARSAYDIYINAH